MASIGGKKQISSNSQKVEEIEKGESREGSIEKKVARDRDEKLKLARERQNEERQRKIEELKAQAEAAQRYREQKEEERRRRIDEIRHRDSEKRQQVEERKRIIMEAERERRDYIIKKNEERDTRLIEAKKRDRSSVVFAFGSSTPRLLEPAEFGTVSPSTFWGQRRSTSISNVAGSATLSRRSSERELADSVIKKRATSAISTDRHDDYRRKSSSMYEVFNWGYSTDEPPKRFSLSIVGSEINIDAPPSTAISTSANTSSAHKQNSNYLTNATAANSCSTKEDNVDTSHIVFRSVARRKTDLMPTIPSPRDGHYSSRSSLSNTPRTPGRAYSMNRLDQLAQPIRRNGEHIRAILERERREHLDVFDETESLGGGRRSAAAAASRGKKSSSASGDNGSGSTAMSRSMTHLAGSTRPKYSLGGGISSSFRPLSNGSRDACKSMTQLTNSWSSTPPRSNLGLQTAATKKYLQSSLASSTSATKRGQQHFTNPYRFDPNSLLLMNSSFLVTAGSQSGNATPGGSINASRPGSAMSTSTTLSTSGYIARRSVPAMRKPRPASIAGTGVSLEEINKHKRDIKPPVKSTTASAQTTPKRTNNMMSFSMIASSSRLSSAEKKTPPTKRESCTPKSLSKTASFDRLNKLSKDKPKEVHSTMAKSAIVTSSAVIITNTPAEKNTNSTLPIKKPDALNSVNSEEPKIDKTPQELNDNEDKIAPVVVDQKNDDANNELNDTKVEAVAVLDAVIVADKKTNNGSKENSVVRELTPPADGNDLMTASMIARNKVITTEKEAKAALAERRRMAREEAERQAEMERQRLEAERLAEIKHQEEEAERQRQFEEEAIRLAKEQREAEEERLRQAIEDVKQREEDERRKRDEEERQRLEREEADKKAKEEAEKQRIEVTERLKREEKEREERRKRVEAIMSRTRKAGGGTGNTPSSTPVKENNESAKSVTNDAQSQQQQQQKPGSTSSESSTTSGTSTTATTPTPIPSQAPIAVGQSLNSQMIYEQSVIEKEAALINSFSNMIIDENAKNRQQNQQPQSAEVTNGKLHAEYANNDALLQNTTAVANGNGHIENISNKNDINILQDVVTPATNQLIDLSIESQDINNAVNFNNNNSLLTTTTLVTADSHENKDISLL